MLLAFLLALSLIGSSISEKVEDTVKSYVETNFGADNAEYQFDFRRVNWGHFPSEFDSVRIFRIGKDSPLGKTIFSLGVYKGNDLIKAVPISVGVSLIVDAVVTTVPVNTGERFCDLDIVKRAVTRKSQLPITDPVKLEGKQARKYIPAGSMIYLSMIENVPVVNAGDRVNIVIEKGLIRITAEGVARQKGGIGDLIRVVNLGSKKVIRAVVVDSTTVALK
jgi:flagella basal body P-ring formation protein FlgA